MDERNFLPLNFFPGDIVYQLSAILIIIAFLDFGCGFFSLDDFSICLSVTLAIPSSFFSICTNSLDTITIRNIKNDAANKAQTDKKLA